MKMDDITKVRYAVLVAIVGPAVAIIPGLTEVAQEWIRALSLVVGALWSFGRIVGEFIDNDDPMVHTMDDRGLEDKSFWATVKRAL
jgi:hypothetical protein